MDGLNRKSREVEVVVADGASVATDPVDVSAYTMLAVFVPTGAEGTHLQFLEDLDGTAKAAKDENASLKVVAFTADQWVDAPVSCAQMHTMWIKTCSDAAGAAQAQTGALTLTVRCKG